MEAVGSRRWEQVLIFHALSKSPLLVCCCPPRPHCSPNLASAQAGAALPLSLMLKELVAGCSHHGNKGHEFLEVTFPISITVQDVHDFVHSLLLFDFLKEKATVPDLF